MGMMASQITNVWIVYWTVCAGQDQRKLQSSASLAFVRGIHRWAVNSPHKGPVTWKLFPFDGVFISTNWALHSYRTTIPIHGMPRQVQNNHTNRKTYKLVHIIWLPKLISVIRTFTSDRIILNKVCNQLCQIKSNSCCVQMKASYTSCFVPKLTLTLNA